MKKAKRTSLDFTAASVATGEHHESYRVDPATGAKLLTTQQAHALDTFKDKRHGALASPTGSGKSVLWMALMLYIMFTDRRARFVVMVPQNIIAGAFDPCDIVVNGVAMKWGVAPANVLTDTSKGVREQIERFVLGPVGATFGERVLLCTQQGFVAAFKSILAKHAGDTDPFAGIGLLVDEAHHSKAGEEAWNRLGEVVKYWIEKDTGRLFLGTATWFRTDLCDIIPEKARHLFTWFVYSLAEFLATAWPKGGRVSVRFMVGPVDKSLAAIAAERRCPTIEWVPPVQSRLTKDRGGKYATLAHHRKITGVEDIDLVTEDGREERVAKLRALSKAGKIKRNTWIRALNLGTEGFDCPQLERGIIIGDRASLQQIYQMLGRVIRVWAGKTSAELILVLPFDFKRGEPDVQQIERYLKLILAVTVFEFQMTLRKGQPRDAWLTLDVMKAVGLAFEATQEAVRDPEAVERDGEDATIRKVTTKAGMGEEAIVQTREVLAALSRRVGKMVDRMEADDLPVPVALRKTVFNGVLGLAANIAAGSARGVASAVGVGIANLTEETILAWAADHRERTGEKPRNRSGTVGAASRTLWDGITWSVVDSALRHGRYGLPGGSSLANLTGYRPGLTEAQIMQWARDHKRRTGDWPSSTDATVLAAQDERWDTIDEALRYGYRGLRGGSSLSRVLGTHNDAPALTAEQIRVWAEHHRSLKGKWPNTGTGTVLASPRETWARIDMYLRAGGRGLPGGSSLRATLGTKPPLSETQIRAWAEEYRSRHGRYPSDRSGGVVGTGDTWSAIGKALRNGSRGLRGGSSLRQVCEATPE